MELESWQKYLNLNMKDLKYLYVEFHKTEIFYCWIYNIWIICMPNLTKLNYFVPEIHISKIQIAEIQIIEIQMAKIQTVEIQILSELGQRWNSLLSQGKVDNFRTTKFDLRTKAKSCSLEEIEV